MPFTFSHPAAVMPLRRVRVLEPLALIIGSMMPDVPSFLPGRLSDWIRLSATHTVRGSVVEDLPLGLFFVAFVLLAREPLTALLSDRARSVALGFAQRFTARPINWLLAIPSVLVGSWTHILWDSFTHRGGWMVRRIAFLREPVVLFGTYTTEVSHLLQYLSSVFGLIVLVFWYWELIAAATPQPAQRRISSSRVRLLLMTGVMIVACTFGPMQALNYYDAETSIYSLLFLLLTRTLAWFAAAYFAVGLVLSIAERSRRDPQPATVSSESQ